MMFPKPQSQRSPGYLAYVRTLPCLYCGARSEAHHWAPMGIAGKGTATKHDDWASVPLCHEHHMEWTATARIGAWDTERCREEFTLALVRTLGAWVAMQEAF